MVHCKKYGGGWWCLSHRLLTMRQMQRGRLGSGLPAYDTAAPRAPPYIDSPVGAGGVCRVFTMVHNKERENLGVGGVYLAVF